MLGLGISQISISPRFTNYAWVDCDRKGDHLCRCVSLMAEEYLSETLFPASGRDPYLEPAAFHVLIEVSKNGK